MLTVGCYAGVEDSDVSDQRLGTAEEIIDNLKIAGYPDSEISVLADGTVFVGSDAIVSLEASREMIDGLTDENDFRQYHTNNLVNTANVQVICVNPTAAFSSNANLSAGLDTAIARYNAQGLQITMQRGGGGCDANISANMDNSGGGVAGFPSGGSPYGSITIGQTVGTYGAAVASHVIAHELGHCVGFRHTDYFNRSISCGGGASNEGDGGVGAVHIPGTPTTNVTSNTSVMNSCFSLSSNGVWTSSDVIALDYLYGAGGGVVLPTWDPVDSQANQSGALNVETQYGPYDASTYDAIRFQISGGTGDADLYVRFGAAPTTGAYDCRPYVGGNEETCEFNPSQAGNYYVMVRAYAAYSGVTLTVEKSGGGDPPPPPPPAEICDNGIDDDGDGATDCDDSDCTADPVCAPPPPPPGGWTELFSDDFESGWGNFNDGGSDCRLLANSSVAHGGTYSVEIRDNSGSASSTYSDAFSLSGYSDLEIDFWFGVSSMENNENFYVELYNGSQWVVVANYVAGSNIDNGYIYHSVVPVSSADVGFSGNAQVRFRNDASNNSDWIYIDDVVVRAQ